MISGVHISTAEMVIRKMDAPRGTSTQFTKNQLVSAKVLDLLPDGRARLLIGGSRITARTDMLLTPGEAVDLKVIQAEGESVVLKLIGPGRSLTPSGMASLASLFSKDSLFTDLSPKELAPLKHLLNTLALKSDKADPDFLPRLIERSGLGLESRIAKQLRFDRPAAQVRAVLQSLSDQDLKVQVFKHLVSMVSKGGGETAKTLAAFGEGLESAQLLNHQGSESGRFLLPFPVFAESGFRFGQLFIDTGGKGASGEGSEGDRVVRLSLLLDMTRLGPLRADFSVFKQEMAGCFLLSDPDTRDYLASLMPELENRLSERQYRVKQLECRVAEPEKLHPMSLVETLVKTRDDKVLNIVV